MTYPLFMCATLYISGVVCAVKNIMDLQCLYWKGLYPVHALVSTKIFFVELTYRRPFSSVEKLMNLQEGGFGLIFVTNSSMSALLGP